MVLPQMESLIPNQLGKVLNRFYMFLQVEFLETKIEGTEAIAHVWWNEIQH